MALIENSKIKESSGGYDRVFSNRALGNLISRVHSTSISAGNELERLIMERVGKIENLDKFLKQEKMRNGVFIAPKKQVKECDSFDHGGIAEPDMIIFKRRGGRQNCYVVELKDGHVFDTKKASAEREALHNFVERNGHRIQYTISCHLCCFNQDDASAIYHGLKKKISIDEILTGRAFCELLEIDYEEIISLRKKDGEKNMIYFIKELLRIDKIKGRIRNFIND